MTWPGMECTNQRTNDRTNAKSVASKTPNIIINNNGHKIVTAERGTKWEKSTQRNNSNSRTSTQRLLSRNKARSKERKVAEAVSENQMSMDVIYATTDYL